jgi:uncharacterized protein YraI
VKFIPSGKSVSRRRILTNWPAAVLTASLGVALVVLAAAPSYAVGTYSTTTAVNVRSGPGTGAAVIGTEPSGAAFTLQCQWQGSTSIGGNATWDEATFTNGLTGAIPDDHTTTPSFNSYAPVTGACGVSLATGSLGGVNMQQACNTQYSGRGLQAIATNASSAYSWICSGPGVSLGINVTAECQTQYGYGAVAAVSNPASAWSWYCHWNITPRMQNAATWAESQLGSTFSSHYGHAWTGWCEEFAEQAEGFQFIYGSATLDYQAEAAAGRIQTGTNPPAGALVFYGPTSGSGHVAVSIGNGQEIGTYGETGTYPVLQYPVTGYLNNNYLGWAIPFGS